MKKEILKRSLFGAPLGIAIGVIITIIISLTVGDGRYYAVVPELVNDMGSEINAVILQTVLCIVYGAAWAGASVCSLGRASPTVTTSMVLAWASSMSAAILRSPAFTERSDGVLS